MLPTVSFYEVSWAKLPYLAVLSRSSRSQIIFEIDILKNFAILTGKHLCWSLFLIKLRNFQEQFFYRTFPVAASDYQQHTNPSFFLYALHLILNLQNIFSIKPRVEKVNFFYIKCFLIWAT